MRKAIIVAALAAWVAGLIAIAYASIPDGSVIRLLQDGRRRPAGRRHRDFLVQGQRDAARLEPDGTAGGARAAGRDSPAGGHVYVSHPNSHVIDNPQPSEQEIVGFSGLPAGNYFFLYRAASADVVRDAARHASLAFELVAEAVAG
jgi:hypothetical protein